MTKLDKLEQQVKQMYQQQSPSRDEWADWLYPNHVLVVADYAEQLAVRYSAPVDLCRAAAILHDLADAVMPRSDPRHEASSLELARVMLTEAGFSSEDTDLIVDDALQFHSCHDGHKPTSLVGQVLSTADALGHLNTDFYTYTTQNLMPGRPEAQKMAWATKKIPRDFYEKIAFDEVRQESKPNFDKLSKLFGE